VGCHHQRAPAPPNRWTLLVSCSHCLKSSPVEPVSRGGKSCEHSDLDPDRDPYFDPGPGLHSSPDHALLLTWSQTMFDSPLALSLFAQVDAFQAEKIRRSHHRMLEEEYTAELMIFPALPPLIDIDLGADEYNAGSD